MARGFSIQVSDPEWRNWLDEAPVTAGTTLLDAMQTSRRMLRWLSEMPSADQLSGTERREIGSDLLHLCDQLAEEVRTRSGTGGIAVIITFAGTMGALVFPPAAPAIALGTLVIGGAFSSNAYNQKRRQDELDGVIKAARRVARDLRR